MFWLLALPLKGGAAQRNRTWELLQEKTSYGTQLSSNYKLDVPELRIGTLDTLLALSDDLVKVSGAVEAAVAKIRRGFADVAPGGAGALASLRVEGLPVDAYLTRFRWDEPKFPLRRPLRETVDKIGEVMARVEDDLKVRSVCVCVCGGYCRSEEGKGDGELPPTCPALPCPALPCPNQTLHSISAPPNAPPLSCPTARSRSASSTPPSRS